MLHKKGLNKNQNIVHVHFLKHIACTTTSFIVSNAYEIFQEKQTNKKGGHFQKSFYQQTEGITQISQGVTVYVCICVCAVCFLSNLLSTWWVYCRGFNGEYFSFRSFEWMVLILLYKLFIFSAFTTSDNLQVRRVRRIFSKPPPHVNFESVWVMATTILQCSRHGSWLLSGSM